MNVRADISIIHENFNETYVIDSLANAYKVDVPKEHVPKMVAQQADREDFSGALFCISNPNVIGQMTTL